MAEEQRGKGPYQSRLGQAKGQKGKGAAERPGPLPPPEEKAVYVQELFGRIAHGYDLMNHLMTLGRDRAWRRHTVAQLNLGPPDAASRSEQVASKTHAWHPKTEIVLDLATGTGDLALEVLRQRPEARVVGLDFTGEMLALAQHKTPTENAKSTLRVSSPKSPDWVAGDALRLPFPDGTFDAVVTGFALRNVTDIPASFAEMARVTRPGGRVACLEITKPRLPIFHCLFALYFYRLVPLLGGWITGQRMAYTYLPHSLTAFLAPDEIAAVMRHTGWHDVHFRRLMLGTVVVHVGVRE